MKIIKKLIDILKGRCVVISPDGEMIYSNIPTDQQLKLTACKFFRHVYDIE